MGGKYKINKNVSKYVLIKRLKDQQENYDKSIEKLNETILNLKAMNEELKKKVKSLEKEKPKMKKPKKAKKAKKKSKVKKK